MGDRQAQRGRVTNHILAWLHSYLQVVISHAVRHQRGRGGKLADGHASYRFSASLGEQGVEGALVRRNFERLAELARHADQRPFPSRRRRSDGSGDRKHDRC